MTAFFHKLFYSNDRKLSRALMLFFAELKGDEELIDYFSEADDEAKFEASSIYEDEMSLIGRISSMFLKRRDTDIFRIQALRIDEENKK